MNTDLALLPRADLPVIWDAFKAQAEPVRQIAETLTVTDISQKEEMALEVYADLKRKNEAEHAIRVIEALQQKRIRDEQAEKVAKLEAELAQERAAKQAEVDAARKLAMAPDVEKLQGYIQALLSVPLPCLRDSTACFVLQNVVDIVNKAAYQVTCFQNELTTK